MFCNEDRIIGDFYQKYDVMEIHFEKEAVIDIASRKKDLRPNLWFIMVTQK